MAVHTIVITATRNNAVSTVLVNRGPAGATGPSGPNVIETADDVATVDLPTLNSPLATVLSGKAATDHGHTVSDISDFPTLATVATTGDYGDLSGTPSIPSSTQVEEYLVDDGIHTLTSSAGVVTPDASNGRSQKFPLTENVTDFNPPTNLADGQSMLVQVLQDATPRSFALDAAWVIMGSGTAADIGSLASGQYAWISITRYGADYLISITAQG